MTIGKLKAVIFIYFVTFAAWMILGAGNVFRTEKSFSKLKQEVASLYGDHLIIYSPQCYEKIQKDSYEEIDGKRIKRKYFEPSHFELSKADIEIAVHLDQRKKGNLWFPTFQAFFKGRYVFGIDDYDPQKKYYVYTTLGSTESIYKDIFLSLNGREIKNVLPLIRRQEMPVVADEQGNVELEISYHCTGMENLFYYITHGGAQIVQIKDFKLKILTDFKNFDFPSKKLSPLEKIETKDGYELIWDLKNAVTGKDIGLTMPNKLNPGEIVSRVTFFAPVSLLFFFAVLFILSIMMKMDFHPMHYFFLAATFFSFHLMYSYFSDHVNLSIAFGIASCVSLILTVTYLRLLTSKRIAYGFAPLTQLIYLIVFSFSFFFKGITGLIVTVCSVLTLFILMQVTGSGRLEHNLLKIPRKIGVARVYFFMIKKSFEVAFL